MGGRSGATIAKLRMCHTSCYVRRCIIARIWTSLGVMDIEIEQQMATHPSQYNKPGETTSTPRGADRSSTDPLTFHSLYKSTLLAITDYHCKASRGGPAAEEYAGSHNIVLLRHGVFTKPLGRRRVTADVNQAIYFSRGLPYRVSHPADCGDRGTVSIVSEPELRNIIREFDPAIDAHPEQPFPFASGPCSTSAFRRQRELVRLLESAGGGDLNDGLRIDETALAIVSDVPGAAYKRLSLPVKSVRSTIAADHAERVEAAIAMGEIV